MSFNDVKKAIGLKYEEGSSPTVVSKGEGELAERIIAAAEEQGILIHEDAQLSTLLQQLQLGQEIPHQLYVVIAELIAFSYVMQGKFPSNWNNMHDRVDHLE